MKLFYYVNCTKTWITNCVLSQVFETNFVLFLNVPNPILLPIDIENNFFAKFHFISSIVLSQPILSRFVPFPQLPFSRPTDNHGFLGNPLNHRIDHRSWPVGVGFRDGSGLGWHRVRAACAGVVILVRPGPCRCCYGTHVRVVGLINQFNNLLNQLRALCDTGRGMRVLWRDG